MKKINIDKERKAIRTFEGIKPFNIKPKIKKERINNYEDKTKER